MLVRLSLIALVLVLLSLVPALAGEDIDLMDAHGKVLKPSQLDQVDWRATCGSCHDFDAKARSVHFVRKDKEPDLSTVDCWTCHAGKFTPKGQVSKTQRVPSPQVCQSCHPQETLTSDMMRNRGKRACYDCHKDAGHTPMGSSYCQGCHSKGGEGPKPRHEGFPKIHFEVIQCETCHIGRGRLGYVMSSGKISPVNANGSRVHHGVRGRSTALTCIDCHSVGSRFFYGKTNTGKTDGDGHQIKRANYESMGLTASHVRAGIVRESFIKPYARWICLLVVLLCSIHYFLFGPRRVKIPPGDTEVPRFSPMERVVHLTALASFLFLAFTGVMFQLRLDSPASLLRPIHGAIGVIFAASVVGVLAVWWKHGMFSKCDLHWFRHFGGYLWIKADCPAEKFNAGQKLFFWTIVIMFGLTVSTSGVLLLLGHGRADGWVFTLHDMASVVLMLGIIGHAYLSIFANPGTIHSMLTGRVKRAWARHHHLLWYEKHFGDAEQKPSKPSKPKRSK